MQNKLFFSLRNHHWRLKTVIYIWIAWTFVFFENRGECDFAISGYIHGNDKLNIKSAIEKALKLCELTTLKMAESEDKE